MKSLFKQWNGAFLRRARAATLMELISRFGRHKNSSWLHKSTAVPQFPCRGSSVCVRVNRTGRAFTGSIAVEVSDRSAQLV
ncbi:hypothetical protein EVAR_26948_1 [Eumeta japonica]|uniref:Uncharacterized protein n=1 Tax=Eumeta variegata TaxID=151549 RepID=A0A4C1VL80_EUMVA|nr:hypothetical protein EVAR_26948_1 [Eumeta japonica]